LLALASAHPENLFVGLALAENASSPATRRSARKRYEDHAGAPPGRPHGDRQLRRGAQRSGTAEAGRRAQAILRPILPQNAEDPLFQKSFRPRQRTGRRLARAGEAFAEAAWLNGRAEDALNQFNALLRRSDLSYIQRSRIEARIAEITPRCWRCSGARSARRTCRATTS
jgi:predicted Zn-dependent protease